MSGLRFVEIQVYGADAVVIDFEATAKRAENISPLANEIFARFEEISREQFSTRGARAGNVWKEPLSYDWLRRKFQAGDRLETLRQSDDTYESLVGRTEHSVRMFTDDTFEFGSTAEAFNYQQDPPHDAEFPIRKPIDLTRQDEYMFSNLINEYVIGEVNTKGQRINPKTGRFVKGARA